MEKAWSEIIEADAEEREECGGRNKDQLMTKLEPTEKGLELRRGDSKSLRAIHSQTMID